MESVEIALALGADAIEMDIRRAPDDLLYISHDRRTGSEIGEKHTLETVFRRIVDTPMKFNCDIKEPCAIAGVVRMAKQFGFGPDRLILTGAVLPALLEEEPWITQECSVWLNVDLALKYLYMEQLLGSECILSKEREGELLRQESCVMAVVDLAKRLGVKGINLRHAHAHQTLVERLHENGLLCSVWTLKETTAIDRVLQLQVDNVTTTTVALTLERKALKGAL
jgi:glycerophosphoryl diester phosphodiesterase